MRENLARGALCLAALLAACAEKGSERPRSADISIGQAISLESELLGETRSIQIALPETYATSSGRTRYPVLYLLDGNLFFPLVAGVVKYLSTDASPRIPEMIVVGISSQERVRDSSPTRSRKGPRGLEEAGYEESGGGDRFLRFLTEELAPYIDKTYSTSGYRVLVGYSFTGLLVMHTVFTRPEAFHAYLAVDPSWWWDDYLLEKEAARFLADAPVHGRSLFVTTTTNNPPAPFFPELRYVDVFAAMLEKTPVQGLHFGMRIYDDETHHSLTLRSVRDGLSHIFDGYAPTLDTLYAHPERMEAQYQALSRRLGTPIFLREDLVTYFGSTLLTTYGEVDKALLHLQLATRHYPSSASAWAWLGDAYAVKGDRAKAIESYEKSLSIDPGNAHAVGQLKTVRP